MRWTIGTIALLVACGPTVASGDGSGGVSQGSTSTGAGASVTTSTSADETGDGARRCPVFVRIDAPIPAYYWDALPLDAGALQRLLLVDPTDGSEATYVMGADAIEGPWQVLDVLEGVEASDRGDVDGDGRDDLVMLAGPDATWWSPDDDGMLQLRGVIEDEFGSDALIRLPGDARAARAFADESLTLWRGHGDGTFEALGSTPPPPDLGFQLPVEAVTEGMLVVRVGPPGPPCPDCETRLVMHVDASGATTLALEIAAYGKLIGTGDIEPDGALDLFTTNVENQLEVWRGSAFGESQVLLDDSLSAAVGDFDGDGATDVLVRDPWMSLHWNDGGVLAAPVPLAYEDEDVLGIEGVVDLDGDGADEVLLAEGDLLLVLRMTACG